MKNLKYDAVVAGLRMANRNAKTDQERFGAKLASLNVLSQLQDAHSKISVKKYFEDIGLEVPKSVTK